MKKETTLGNFATAVALGLAVACSALPAKANYITSDPSLPPGGFVYRTPDDIHAKYHGPALEVILRQIQHAPYAGTTIRTPVGTDEQETFDSRADGIGSVNGSPEFAVSLLGPVTTIVHDKVGNVTGTFQTEMLSMDLSGNGIMIRESPTKPSLGQTTITDMGGGQYCIDSFFDIFTELSVDNGTTWLPADESVRVHGSVPDTGSTLLLLTAALGTLGWFTRRERLAGAQVG